MYIVTSKPKRISVNSGLLHIVFSSDKRVIICGFADRRDRNFAVLPERGETVAASTAGAASRGCLEPGQGLAP
jgi:hypothetical protein